MKTFKILLIFLIIVSCSSKKKITNRSNEQITITKEKSKVQISEESATVIITEENKSDVIIISENDELEFTQADPDKEFSFKVEGGPTTTVKGANMTKRSTNKAEAKKETAVKTTKKKSQKKDSIANESKSIIDSNKKARSSDSKSWRTNTFVSIGAALALIIGVVVFINKKRKPKG